ncbi:jg19344, partial [Pararge aegeria aegeria]
FIGVNPGLATQFWLSLATGSAGVVRSSAAGELGGAYNPTVAASPTQ